jgi:BNR repeat-like domain
MPIRVGHPGRPGPIHRLRHCTPYFSKTTDGGNNWSSPQAMTNANIFSIGNQIVVEPDGTLIEVFHYGKGSGIDQPKASLQGVMRSTDGGKHWSPPITISNNPGNNDVDPDTLFPLRTGADIGGGIPDIGVRSRKRQAVRGVGGQPLQRHAHRHRCQCRTMWARHGDHTGQGQPDPGAGARVHPGRRCASKWDGCSRLLRPAQQHARSEHAAYRLLHRRLARRWRDLVGGSAHPPNIIRRHDPRRSHAATSWATTRAWPTTARRSSRSSCRPTAATQRTGRTSCRRR